MKIMKNFSKGSLPRFKKSLFCEGLRQLRAVGIAYTVIVALVTLPIITEIGHGEYQHITNVGRLSYFMQGQQNVFLIASAFAVLAVFYISNFMRSAKARDFYCATPHSHGTLWLNFAASALTWMAAGVLTYFLVTVAVTMPFDAKAFGALFFIACNIFASAFMVFGMATLAVTLTGRLVPALITFAGLLAMSCSLKVTHAEGWNAIFTKFALVANTSDLRLYDPIYLILKRMFLDYSYSNEIYTVSVDNLFSSWSTIRYGMFMGASMLAVAAVFGTVRTGDAVGKPFVNEPAHVISLTIAALPLATVATFFLPDTYLYFRYDAQAAWANDDWLVFLIIVLIVVGGFWAIELLLTFDIRHAHRAYKYLPIPLAVSVASLLIGFFGMKAAFNTVPTADEVESFTLVRNDVLPDELAFFRMSETFGRAVTNETEFTDKETIAYVTGKMKELSDEYGHDMQKAYDAHSIWEDEKTGMSNAFYHDGKGNDMIIIRLNLKNGRQLTRMVSFDNAHVKAMESAMLSDSDFMKKFLTLPSADNINVGIDSHSGMSGDEAVAIYKSFAEEYNALSDTQKLEYIKTSILNNYVNEEYYEYGNDEDDENQTDDTVEKEVSIDINLISKSKEVGDFGIVETYYNQLLHNETISVDISGYPEGSLYNEDQFFMQIFTLDNKRFPKTVALTVRTCNSKFAEIRDQIKKVQSSDEFRCNDIDADYFSGGNHLNVVYLYISGKDAEKASLSVKGENVGRYSDDVISVYKDVEDSSATITTATTEDETVIFKDIEVDSNEMIERLFNDAAATETVDFTKPFCRFTWNNYDSYKNGLPGNMTFYAQTENPVDYLHLLADEQPQTETKGKKK